MKWNSYRIWKLEGKWNFFLNLKMLPCKIGSKLKWWEDWFWKRKIFSISFIKRDEPNIQIIFILFLKWDGTNVQNKHVLKIPKAIVLGISVKRCQRLGLCWPDSPNVREIFVEMFFHVFMGFCELNGQDLDTTFRAN